MKVEDMLNKPKPVAASDSGVPDYCTCAKGTSQWQFIDHRTQRCRRCGAVRVKVQ